MGNISTSSNPAGSLCIIYPACIHTYGYTRTIGENKSPIQTLWFCFSRDTEKCSYIPQLLDENRPDEKCGTFVCNRGCENGPRGNVSHRILTFPRVLRANWFHRKFAPHTCGGGSGGSHGSKKVHPLNAPRTKKIIVRYSPAETKIDT